MWQKGQSGNRAGRPKGGAGVAAYIRQQCGDDLHELIDRLLELSRDPRCPIRERVGATMHLLDRAVGKPLATEVSLRLHDAPQLPAGFAAWPVEQRSEYLLDLRRHALQGASDDVVDSAEVEDDGDR